LAFSSDICRPIEPRSFRQPNPCGTNNFRNAGILIRAREEIMKVLRRACYRCAITLAALVAAWVAPAAVAQQPQGVARLTLRQAAARAVDHSREVALARLRHEGAQRETDLSRSRFLPNLYAGSGAAFSSGFPLAAGGGAPAVVSLTYNQALIDPIARGELRAAEQREEQMRLALDDARDATIVRVAASYLELAKVRRSGELLLGERESAARILAYMRQRASAGLELPIEVTRAQLTAARVEQSIVRLHDREEALVEQLRSDLGLAADEQIEVVAEDLPSAGEPADDFAEVAVENSVAVRQAASEREAFAARLRGERSSRWPTFSITGQYNLLARFNNYDEFFNKFQRHNFIAGVEISIPLFAARTSAGIAAAEANLAAADLLLEVRRAEVSRGVRQRSRQSNEAETAREVARLELELAQQNTGVVQAQFNEGRASIRDLEAAQLDQNSKWLAFLDADFALQQARLDLLRATGQVAQLAQ
jgi:outer membrane protein TolC